MALVTCLAQGFTSLFLRDTTLYHFWDRIATKEIPFQAINSALVASIAVGLFCAAIDHYKLLNRFGKALRITNKYGDESLFYFFLNARNIDEVYVRDFESGLTYHGLLVSYSEGEDVKEIVLRDVRVYATSTSAELYTLDKIYLSLPKQRIVIEVPLPNATQTDNAEDNAEVDSADGRPDQGQSEA